MEMVIISRSIKTPRAIVSGYTSDLMSRATNVTLKKGRSLILAVREIPLRLGHPDLMRRTAQMGAVIMPHVPAFYRQPCNLQDLIDQTVGRVLLRIGIENNLYTCWREGP
jgi:4-hydroxy-3-polyprenylbenzoate decarboxylase